MALGPLGGSHESFLKVIAAFTVLSNPLERQKYDAQLLLRKDLDGVEQAPKAFKPSKAFSRPLRPKPQAPEASPESALQWQRLLKAKEAEWEEILKARMSSNDFKPQSSMHDL